MSQKPIKALYADTSIPLTICRSNAGYYIGREDPEDGQPYARDSEEYFRTGDEAEMALATGQFTLRTHP